MKYKLSKIRTVSKGLLERFSSSNPLGEDELSHLHFPLSSTQHAMPIKIDLTLGSLGSYDSLFLPCYGRENKFKNKLRNI